MSGGLTSFPEFCPGLRAADAVGFQAVCILEGLQGGQGFPAEAAVNPVLRKGEPGVRQRLLQTFRRCAHRGYAAPDERQNFENMYVQYHSLGGNGVMDDVRRKFFALPMEKERNEAHD